MYANRCRLNAKIYAKLIAQILHKVCIILAQYVTTAIYSGSKHFAFRHFRQSVANSTVTMKHTVFLELFDNF